MAGRFPLRLVMAGSHAFVEREQPPDALTQLDELACNLTVSTLENRGSEVSNRHQDVLLHASTILTQLADGSVTGRYVFDLPAGLGKTTLLICWIKAMVHLGLSWSVAVCAAQVRELQEIRKQLMLEPYAVPEELVGLWHSKDDAEVPPTFAKDESERYGSRRILLLTHSRMQKSHEIAKRLRYQGRSRDLVVYDESLVTTAAWELPYAEVVGAIKELRARLGHEGPVSAYLGELSDALDQEIVDQSRGAPPRLLALPTADRWTVREVDQLAHSVLKKPSALSRLFRKPEAGFRALVVGSTSGQATLIRTDVTVPDELERVVVLDASFPVRSLLRLANERMNKDAAQLRLKTVKDVWPWVDPGFKHYDHLTINLMPTRRSGRSFFVDDVEFDEDLSTIDKEIASVVADIPPTEAVLIWTFLKGDRMPDFSKRLRRALRAAGLDPDGTIEVDGHMLPRTVIDTFGREAATNEYRYCTNVIFTGCLEPPRQTLAAQYVAETRDLTIPVSGEDIDRLIRGEVWHRIYQGITRAACRDVWVDDDGRTQAKATRVWLFTRHHEHIRDELGRMLPGAQWKLWMPKHMGEDALAKEATAAMLIREILDGLDRDKISLMALRKMQPLLRDMSRTHFQRARDRAISGTDWVLQGGSLVRVATAPGLAMAA